MKMKARYKLNKELKVGDNCICPTCSTSFVKSNYQQAFCRTKPGTFCKDGYWNVVDPKKRNNTTRISPASARWMAKQESYYDDPHNDPDYDPGDSEYWDSKNY